MMAGCVRADEGIRTPDIYLGKVVLYQLSYVRVMFDSNSLRNLRSRPSRTATGTAVNEKPAQCPPTVP